MTYFGWQLVVAFAVICLLSACTQSCLVADPNAPCDFMAEIGIPI